MTVPIGSIVAFGGRIHDGWEQQEGWLLCDGRLLDGSLPEYEALLRAIGFSWGGDDVRMFNLPDLQGYFLRGVDGVDKRRDPDSDSRSANNPGGGTGNSVGTVQPWGTGLAPEPEPIAVGEAGRHFHTLLYEVNATRDVDGQDNTVASNAGSMDWTSTEGPHIHELTGGSRETRPINAAVHWIIRFR